MRAPLSTYTSTMFFLVSCPYCFSQFGEISSFEAAEMHSFDWGCLSFTHDEYNQTTIACSQATTNS